MIRLGSRTKEGRKRWVYAYVRGAKFLTSYR